MDEVITLINNVGVPVAMLIYFAWRDMKYMTKIDSTLDVIKAFVIKEDTKHEDSSGIN